MIIKVFFLPFFSPPPLYFLPLRNYDSRSSHLVIPLLFLSNSKIVCVGLGNRRPFYLYDDYIKFFSETTRREERERERERERRREGGGSVCFVVAAETPPKKKGLSTPSCPFEPGRDHDDSDNNSRVVYRHVCSLFLFLFFWGGRIDLIRYLSIGK